MDFNRLYEVVSIILFFILLLVRTSKQNCYSVISVKYETALDDVRRSDEVNGSDGWEMLVWKEIND